MMNIKFKARRSERLKKYKKIKDWKACAKLCNANPECKAFTFIGLYKHKCYLWKVHPTGSSKKGYTSGYAGCSGN